MTGEFTLNSPLTKEDWDKIADVELEKTKRIWFKTPSGKSVEFIPMSVIDTIKAEIIEEYKLESENLYGNGMNRCFEIIEKHIDGGAE